MARVDVHIAVPVYNNLLTIGAVVEALETHGVPIVVVDDGSDDGTAEELDRLDVTVLHHDRNRGKGAALLTAARHVGDRGGTHLICFDGDGQLDPADLPRMLEAVAAEPDHLIYGIRRFGAEVPGLSVFGRKFSNFWTRVTTGQKVLDSQCGFRAYPLPVLLGLKLHGRRYDFEVEVLVKAAWAGVGLTGVPVQVTYEPPGGRVTHFRPIVDNARISRAYTRLVLRSVLPVPPQVVHQRPGESGQTVLSPWRPMRLLRAFLQERSSPKELAAAAALGFFLATLPLIGFHSLAIIFAATVLRLNRLLAFSVSHLCAPPVVPAICLEVGYRLRHGAWLSTFNADTLWHQVGDRFLEYLLGTLVVAPVLAALGGGLTWVVASMVARRSQKDGTGEPRDPRGLTGRYGSRLGVGVFHLVLRTAGLRAAYLFLWLVVPYYVLLRPSARRSPYPYLRHRFPDAGRFGLVLHSFRSIMAFSRSIVDQAAVAIMGPGYFDLEVTRQAELARLLEAEGGTILLLSHVGNWRAVTPSLAIASKTVNLLLFQDPTSPVAGPEGAPDVLGSTRIIDPTGPFGGLLAAADALMRGEIVSIMGDRHWGGRTIAVEFLGATAHIPASPYRLAKTTETRLLMLLVASAGHRRYHIDFYDLSSSPRGDGNGREALAEQAQRYMTHVEEFVHRHPYSWFNFFDFWAAPADATRRHKEGTQ